MAILVHAVHGLVQESCSLLKKTTQCAWDRPVQTVAAAGIAAVAWYYSTATTEQTHLLGKLAEQAYLLLSQLSDTKVTPAGAAVGIIAIMGGVFAFAVNDINNNAPPFVFPNAPPFFEAIPPLTL